MPECLGKIFEALKVLNCGVGPAEFNMFYWVHFTLPYLTSNLKNVVVLFGGNNLQLDSLKHVTYDILEIARSFQTNYSSVNIVICGILPRENSLSGVY